MMTKNQALSLEQGVRVKYGREIFIVDHRTDVGTHEEPVLISESGRRLVGTIFIAHLLSFVDRPQAAPADSDSDPIDSFEDDLGGGERDDDGDEDSNPGHFPAAINQVDQVDLSLIASAPEAPAQEISHTEPPAGALAAELSSAAPVHEFPEQLVEDDIPPEELVLLQVCEKDEAI